MKSSNEPALRTIAVADGWTIPDESGIGQRTLVEGTIWNLPVVASVTPAPTELHPAARHGDHPSVPPDSEWIASGDVTGDTSGRGYYRWSADDTVWENTKDATQHSSLSYYLQFAFNGVAGYNYIFTWAAHVEGARPDASHVSYDVLIGGAKVYGGSTDKKVGGASIYLDPHNGGSTTAASASFQAAADCLYTFRYRIRLSQLGAGHATNHNIIIGKPTLTCS
ncbi:hypothetical protein C5C66_00980 [Rathayibacter toxicus]|uniref:Uncharacterized protein n=1 Tax=Rathayibacter toxicus TaxID=145458 RepID=A0A0C5BQM8_9MICO|nr:hypothetical protein [Rathayibacter toxicus]AJM76952.1 hypothetical protein TI83_01155 [Rathayibacter toxicus]ALS57261.1 hypothetical protein APU90_05320 [Rathayibacter toxicus]KKM44376.1 hypothetical protein VT73_10045 [Rathayibacter toxicus]PPG24863.1 hypothetical protein C5D15_00965 [Rathayibacter toxicus]PPG48318.1 hypothetical protein C5D16_00980 [Rathayibacter toxicus]